MDAVFEKTRELGEALLESRQYIEMKSAEERAMKNGEASAVMEAYVNCRKLLQEEMASNDPDAAQMKRLSDEMDELQEKMQLIDDITELSRARNEFNALIGQINQLLQFIVTGTMDEDDGSCGGNCGGSCARCSGCAN